eukprot:SAG31_NODE_103_length_25164_cov_12.124317_1_plen_35_part_00
MEVEKEEVEVVSLVGEEGETVLMVDAFLLQPYAF